MAMCSGYSKDEYVSAVAAALSDRYEVSFDEAYELASASSEVRYYGGGYAGMGRNGAARSPQSQATAIATGKERVGWHDERRVRLRRRR